MNTPTPIVNIRRRPNRSPSAAPVSSRHANDRLYALTVHSRLERLACRLTRSTGNDVVTTSVSSAVINTPIEARTTVHAWCDVVDVVVTDGSLRGARVVISVPPAWFEVITRVVAARARN